MRTIGLDRRFEEGDNARKAGERILTRRLFTYSGKAESDLCGNEYSNTDGESDDNHRKSMKYPAQHPRASPHVGRSPTTTNVDSAASRVAAR
jgi:hypothetical protein